MYVCTVQGYVVSGFTKKYRSNEDIKFKCNDYDQEVLVIGDQTHLSAKPFVELKKDAMKVGGFEW